MDIRHRICPDGSRVSSLCRHCGCISLATTTSAVSKIRRAVSGLTKIPIPAAESLPEVLASIFPSRGEEGRRQIGHGLRRSRLLASRYETAVTTVDENLEGLSGSRGLIQRGRLRSQTEIAL